MHVHSHKYIYILKMQDLYMQDNIGRCVKNIHYTHHMLRVERSTWWLIQRINPLFSREVVTSRLDSKERRSCGWVMYDYVCPVISKAQKDVICVMFSLIQGFICELCFAKNVSVNVEGDGGRCTCILYSIQRLLVSCHNISNAILKPLFTQV